MNPPINTTLPRSDQQLQMSLLAPVFAHDCANYMLILEGLFQAMDLAHREQRNEDLSGLMGRMGQQIDLLSNFFLGFLGRETDLRTASIQDLVTGNVAIFSDLGMKAGVSFEAGALGPLGSVHAPKLDFSRVLINLLNNALQASSELPPNSRRVLVHADPASEHTLQIVNPCPVACDCEENSAKGLGQLGLKSVTEICEASGVRFSSDTKDGYFVVRLDFSTLSSD